MLRPVAIGQIDAEHEMNDLKELSAYTQYPARLLEMYPELKDVQKKDEFGVWDRLDAIRQILRNRKLGKLADLGGNSGFFSLSLIDIGLAERSVIYDLEPGAVTAGRRMSESMGLSDRTEYREQALGLEFVNKMDEVDTVLCLNLIHHAGAVFDMEPVQRIGWDAYALQWLTGLRRRSRLAIFGIGFKGGKPPYWDTPHADRPRRFCQLGKNAGWTIIYEANVGDIHRLGPEPARGLRTRKVWFRHIRHYLRARYGVKSAKRDRYHLFIFE